MKLLSNYVTSAKVYSCPSDRRSSMASSYAELARSNLSYSYVPNVVWKQDQGNAIIALDRILTTAAGSGWSASGNHRRAKFLRFEGRGGNILFADGHCAWNTNLPTALKDRDGKEVVLSP